MGYKGCIGSFFMPISSKSVIIFEYLTILKFAHRTKRYLRALAHLELGKEVGGGVRPPKPSLHRAPSAAVFRQHRGVTMPWKRYPRRYPSRTLSGHGLRSAAETLGQA